MPDISFERDRLIALVDGWIDKVSNDRNIDEKITDIKIDVAGLVIIVNGNDVVDEEPIEWPTFYFETSRRYSQIGMLDLVKKRLMKFDADEDDE